MTNSDTLIESRELRERHIGQTEVLDKVKALTFLPGDTYLTTEMVASFYEVGVEAIKAAVFDNRSEVETDGYRVVEGDELRFFKDLSREAAQGCSQQLSEISPRARSLALFPRRAILRLGMLLRDSDVARRIRDHLLDVEARQSTELSEIEVARRYLAALEQREADRLLIATQRAELEAAAPKVAYVDTFVDPDNDATIVAVVAAGFNVTENVFREYLKGRKVLRRRQIDQYRDRHGKKRTDYEWLPRAGFESWFVPKEQLDIPRMRNGQPRTTLYFTPVGKQGVTAMVRKFPLDPPRQLAIDD